MINASLISGRHGRHDCETNQWLGRRPMLNEATINRCRRCPIARQFSGFEAPMDKVDCVVVGAGVIGLAVARRLAQAGREVIVLEEAEGIGTVTSSRNSEVIHAGIYYPAGSWMARMCVTGKHRALSLLRRARHPLQELRQADRRDHAGGDRKAAGDPRPCRGQRRRRHADAVRRRGARAGAGAELRRRAALALHRDHRQPRLHAVAARRGRSRRRGVRVSHAADPRQGERRPDRARDRRRRADDARLRSPGQRRRPRRAGGGAQHRGHADRT